MHDSTIRQSYWNMMHGGYSMLDYDYTPFDHESYEIEPGDEAEALNDRDYDEYAEAGADEIFGKGI